MTSSQCPGAGVGERDPLAREAGEVHQAVERLPTGARPPRTRLRPPGSSVASNATANAALRRRVPLDRGGQIEHRDFEAVGQRRRDERAADAAAAAGDDEPRPGRRAEAGRGRGCGARWS